MGEYTHIDILLGSHLSPRAVQTKLTPRLGLFVGVIEEELNFAMDNDFPPCKGASPTLQRFLCSNDVSEKAFADQWVTMDLNDVILCIVSCITARIFVGDPLCRNEEWQSLNIQIVEEIFRTVVIMRVFPPSLHRIISIFLPSRWRLQQCMQRIHNLLIPVINQRRENEAAKGETYEKPADVIQWMMDLANETESPPDNLATRYVYTIIGSMHTVTSAIKDTLYDICARPEYVQPLREELEHVLQEDEGWKKGTASKTRKLDSVMKEVQRLNPPSACECESRNCIEKGTLIAPSTSGVEEGCPRAYRSIRWSRTPKGHLYLRGYNFPLARRDLRSRRLRRIPLLQKSPGLW